MKICLFDAGHMNEMGNMSIYGKNPSKIFFTGTGRSISTKLGIKHWGLLPIIVYSNGDPGVTLTFLKAKANLVIQGFLLETVEI